MWGTRYSLRSIALYGQPVIFPADDGGLVVLDMKTGSVVWDVSGGVKALYFLKAGGVFSDCGRIVGNQSPLMAFCIQIAVECHC